MKHVLRGLFSLLLLLPTLLWIMDSRSHQLGVVPLEGDRAFLKLMQRVSSGSHPFIAEDRLFLISISDPYIYEFTLEEVPTLVSRFEVGGKDKEILPIAGEIVLGYQEERIKNQLTTVKKFDFASRSIETLVASQRVVGDMSNNVLTRDGWMYLWGLDGNQMKLIWTDGHETHSKRIGLFEAGDQAGFHLNLPIRNLPLFEVRDNAGEKNLNTDIFLTPDGLIEFGVTFEETEVLGASLQKLNNLVKSSRYSQFYLQADKLFARLNDRSQEWEAGLSDWVNDQTLMELTETKLKDIKPIDFLTDVYSWPELQLVNTRVDSAYLYPKDRLIDPDFQSSDLTEAVALQQRLVVNYQTLLEQNDRDRMAYLKSGQVRDYVGTPTSIGLVICQVLGLIGIKGIIGRGEQDVEKS